ncbi:oxidoreductase [Ktedonobacteria bacterium brp13]|nr:oxidoreductase [Ktedonobacteria bacterium brp13]
MTAKIRFGIIGCGVIGLTHAAAIQSLPDAELIAVADVIPASAHKLAEQYHVTAYENAQELLTHEHLDVVEICTPSGMHGEFAILAMRAGCNVIVEKPMEITHERMLEMLAVQRETGVKLAVVSQHRFDEASIQVHKLLTERALGRLVLGNAAIPWWRSQQYYDSGAWRGTRELDGGGILMNQSIHAIDILQWLMGRVKTIKAYTDTLVHDMETEDVAVAVLRFESGALGTISATTGAYPGVTTRIEVYGNQGSAIIEADKLGYLHLARDEQEAAGAYGGGGNQAAPVESVDTSTTSDPAALSANTHALQIADMMAAIREGRAPLVDGEAARHPVEIILGIYESARTGKEITLS